MSDDTYNGWANRETWAFWLHVTNDQGMYYETIDLVKRERLAEQHVRRIGERVTEYWEELLEDLYHEHVFDVDRLLELLRDIGSWWRIDHAEIGAAARELVDES